MNFTPATDDVHHEVHTREQLAAAIRAVQPGHATIITLHRASGAITRYLFNWREWRRARYSKGKTDRELQELYLHKSAQKALALPKRCFL